MTGQTATVSVCAHTEGTDFSWPPALVTQKLWFHVFIIYINTYV